MSERTLEQALAHAEEVRFESAELAKLAGADSDVFDLVLLADEILRLRIKPFVLPTKPRAGSQ